MNLNARQLEATYHLDGPLLVIAGAGSGKTRIVTHRICHLIEHGVSSSAILAVTFTNKAAQEMQERVTHLLSHKTTITCPTICTFHSLGTKILRESIHRLGYLSNFTIYDEEDVNKLLKFCLQNSNMNTEKGDIKAYRQAISAVKSKLLKPEEVDEPALAQLYRLYQQKLKEANACDFDDLLYLTVQLLMQDQEIKEYYQSRWPYLLIDEYQDTNHAQYMMANLIVEKSHNLFVVGDPDQSIYSWRGANISNILNFERDYPGARTIRLEQNYRSRANILHAANALIQHNLSRLEKNLWSDRGDGAKISLYVGQDGREEADFVVQEMLRLHRLHQIPFSQMTIFYRTNFQSRLFEDALLIQGVAYTIVGGISFYQRKEIKDILAFLRMLESDVDKVSFVRTVNIPNGGLGQKTLESILIHCQHSVIEFCHNPIGVRLREGQKACLKQYASIILQLKELKKELPLSKLIIEVIRQTNYLEVLKEDKETYEDRKANVDELISKAYEWEMNREGLTLTTFLEELSLKASIDEASFANDRVNLMTLHNGKGLEFAAIFLVGMEEDLFPHINSRESYDQLEEERRLCYVGMTRARELLYLTAAERRMIWGSYRMMRPSRFLKEIPREYIQRIGSI